MKDYELSVVFHPDLEMNLDPALDKVKKTVEQVGGKITKEENEGKKRLSYTIKGQDYGLFYYFDVQLSAEAPSKISTALNITDEVLRYLLVRTDEHKAKMEAHRKADANEGEIESNQEKGE